jgi:large subunit ribosomal protein L10
MNRTEKQEAIQTYNGMFNESGSVVVCHYKGLTMPAMNKLRAKLREEGGSFTVTKNTLAKLAAKDTDYEGLSDLFTGPTGIVYSQDPVAAAKVAYNFAKENDKLVILGGGLGAKVLDKSGVEALAKLPSLDEVRGKLVGLLQAPATQIARILNAPAQNLVGVTQAYGQKGE